MAPRFAIDHADLSFGGFVEYDARDKIGRPDPGFDIYGRIASNDGMKNHAAFSDYGWLESEIDVRGYIPLEFPNISRPAFKRSVQKHQGESDSVL
jgi:hypothetical protein